MLEDFGFGAFCLATALAGTAFCADAACACANDFVAAAHRTSNAHEDAPKSDHDPVVVTVSVATVISRARALGWIG